MLYDVDTNDDPSGGGDKDGELTNKELQEFVLVASQQVKFQAQAHNYNETCWDICVEKPGAKLDNKTSTCLSNCVNRFIDVTLYVTNRYYNMLQRGAGRI